MRKNHSPKKIHLSLPLKRVITIAIITIVTSYIGYGAYLYNTRVREKLSETTLTMLSEVASQQQLSVSAKIRSDIASIKSIAYSLVVLGYDRESIIDYLSVIESYYNFQNITILNENKIGIASNGRDVDFTNNAFFDEILMGKTLISIPQNSLYSDEKIVLIATPIFEYGKIAGLVSAEFPIDYLNDLLFPTFDNRGYSYIVDDYGTIIAKSKNNLEVSSENIFSLLKQGIFSDGIQAQDVINSIIQGKTGRETYHLGGERRVFEYRPLAFTGWAFILSITDDVLNENVSVILSEMNAFNLKLLLGTVLTVIFVIFLRTQSGKAIKKAAYYDSLTGIANLTKFKMDVSAILKKYPFEKFTIVHFDIVNFKAINDFYDFTVGDKVLKAIADTGRTATHKLFLQGRIEKDDFLLFCTYDFFKDLETLRHHYEAVFRTFVPEIEQHSLSYRYGRYAIEDNNEDINEIINKVLLAHSYGKHNGNDSITDYTSDFRTRLLKSTEITNKQSDALKNKDFKVYLQPKCCLQDGKVVGAEALVRWQEKDGNMIFPNDFIPLFENNGFIVDLDMYMLERVCETLASWKSKGYPCIPISVNFSRRHLDFDNFAGKIEEVANRYNADKHCIEIELTEGIFFDKEDLLREILADLHKRGFTLSMDDFGTGYSSLGLLHTLPVDVIKLDRSFFTKTEEAERAVVIVESIAQMTHRLGIPTVAEGVETKAQVDFLRTIGCDIAQGYYYSKPIPLDEFEENWLPKVAD